MIEGVWVYPLKQIPDERGKIMHMLRSSDPHFVKFGEIYFSTAYPGVIKGWHFHHRVILNYAVIVGMIKLVLFDDREGSPTRGELMELFVGESNYALIKIPPKVWNGYKCIGVIPAVVANCATESHDPTEMERLDPFSKRIPYDWALVNR
ncbi:MAG: dTDP-4-dehydrorhamnose 3,5-epimerase family protein [Chlamydiae bacterium]|nr:dTDP-4-dehydrorhamnose 3,5-epimerase family protein [Chlamydiota bacterium]MBI3276214.1 dTDP-4-dehydrorhamnose 3,5-epimerase family protein [Chlamydiota bacterium]